MARFETFDRDIKVATAGLTDEAISKKLAAFARAELAKAISSGKASTTYEKYVNARRGAPEEAVVPPGPILYVFTNWPLVVRTALAELVKRSPKRTGRYAAGFMVLANGMPVRDYSKIKSDDVVTIFNVRPYTRKIEVGANGTGRRHVDLAKRALSRRFKEGFVFETRFLDMRAGLHPEVPYRVKRSQGRRKDRQAGMPITYPAIVMRVV